ncbi:Mov34/MPN/PAD-1 family protein [Thioalkalivibrio sp. ALE31]|uniref:Mov34/MPN/PAD-1 family protein n=1 Tax=Thioalkalivibrio sp. ALE31 TaxID=1158182 RepID=UPI0009D94F76|nr:Mov34/MPN/PAD-1 family protein [Thioalkalivibrio sp. ALE31]
MSEPPTVWIAEPASRLLHEVAEAQYPLETGGSLLGYAVGDDFVVMDIVGPGPGATHQRYRFSPDADFQQEAINVRFFATQGRETYLGDWHTHPDGQAQMSWLDRRTLSRIARKTPDMRWEPLMLLLAGRPYGWSPAAFLHAKSGWPFGLHSAQRDMTIRYFTPH